MAVTASPAATVLAPVTLSIAGIHAPIGHIDIPLTFAQPRSAVPGVLTLTCEPDTTDLRGRLAALLRATAEVLEAAGS